MTRSERIENLIKFINNTFNLWFDDAEEAFIHGEDFPLADLNVIITLSLLGNNDILKLFTSLNDDEMKYVLKELKK